MSTSKKIVIFGATSLIAHETARNFAKEKAEFLLISRVQQKLEEVKNDLLVIGAASAKVKSCELSDNSLHESLQREIESELPDFDTALIAYGSLSDQQTCEKDPALTLREINTNFNSVTSILTLLANYFEKRNSGTIAVITSVAGDRGRKKNYVYGSAKAALNVFLEGMRNRFGKTNIQILTIKPGFVDTPMTRDFKKGLLFAKAEKVGKDIYSAINKKKDQIYTPFYWRYIMLIIRHIPEFIFKKLNI